MRIQSQTELTFKAYQPNLVVVGTIDLPIGGTAVRAQASADCPLQPNASVYLYLDFPNGIRGEIIVGSDRQGRGISQFTPAGSLAVSATSQGLDPGPANLTLALHSYRVDKNELIAEALLLLVEIHPLQAAVLWLHYVEGLTEEEIAERLGVSVKTVQRLPNGYTLRGEYIWGGKDWLRHILDLFLEAIWCDGFEEMVFAFVYARRSNPPFSASLLDIFWQAMDADRLESLLALLREAGKGGCYVQVIWNLLELYDQGQLF